MDIKLWVLTVFISASGGCFLRLLWAGAKTLEREADAYARGWETNKNKKGDI